MIVCAYSYQCVVWSLYMITDYIRSDLCRYVGKDNITLRFFLKNYFLNSGFTFSVWLRIGRFTNNRFLRLVAKVQHRRISKKNFLDIPIKTEIGYGLYIGHGKSVVVNPTAKIGNNVNLSQFVTIGANHGQAAHIGNNVYIGPNVCIVEDVKIGDNVKIGAGAVVTKDIPENAICAGVPAKVFRIDTNPNSYVNRRW